MVNILEIIDFLEDEIVIIYGEQNCLIEKPVSLNSHCVVNGISFCRKNDLNTQELINNSSAVAIICPCFLDAPPPELYANKTLLCTKNPRLAFIRVMNKFFSLPKKNNFIDPTVIVGVNTFVASSAYIGAYVTIGANCVIGEGSVINSGVHVYDNVTIGANVIIDSGAVIGADGFGFERNSNRILKKFPHIGGVTIEDDVEIGANTCIDRGTLEDTVIGFGTKLDNQVHISHNVKIGNNCVVVAGVIVGGSVTIGDGVWLAPGSTLMNKIIIAENNIVGLGAVVFKDVIEKDSIVIGNPGKVVRQKLED